MMHPCPLRLSSIQTVSSLSDSLPWCRLLVWYLFSEVGACSPVALGPKARADPLKSPPSSLSTPHPFPERHPRSTLVYSLSIWGRVTVTAMNSEALQSNLNPHRLFLERTQRLKDLGQNHKTCTQKHCLQCPLYSEGLQVFGQSFTSLAQPSGSLSLSLQQTFLGLFRSGIQQVPPVLREHVPF